MKTNLILLVLCGILLASCGKEYGGQSISGTQSDIGLVGNTFDMSTVQGIINAKAEITELNDGISKIEYTCEITDSKMLAMAKYIPGATFTGNKIVAGGQAKLTDKGIMNVYDEGNLILVKYDDKVGDTYSLKRGANTITREITSKSTEDDYFWGWMMIKTMKIEETGRGIPGVSKIEYVTNHKFGLVGIKVEFEDGTSKSIDLYSQNSD
ncbi:MAG: hypothetical protein V2A67_12135 [Bacteroidota bacterium]